MRMDDAADGSAVIWTSKKDSFRRRSRNHSFVGSAFSDLRVEGEEKKYIGTASRETCHQRGRPSSREDEVSGTRDRVEVARPSRENLG
ncbi:MAG: hypothetical protein WC483_00110 [Candidatus Paceibacterota bacterium]